MNRKWKLLYAAAMLALALGAHSAAAKEEIYYNFENLSLAPFEVQADSSVKGYSLSLWQEDTGNLDMVPNHYANLKFTPSGPKSAAWIGVGYESFGIEMVVHVEFEAMDTGRCKGCVPLVYVGAQKPVSGSQFSDLAPQGVPLPGAWTPFKHDTTVKADQVIYVAIGVRAAHAKDGFTGSIGLDDITLRIYPAP